MSMFRMSKSAFPDDLTNLSLWRTKEGSHMLGMNVEASMIGVDSVDENEKLHIVKNCVRNRNKSAHLLPKMKNLCRPFRRP